MTKNDFSGKRYLDIPSWAEWKSISRNGFVRVFDHEPVLHNGCWEKRLSYGRCDCVGIVPWSDEKSDIEPTCEYIGPGR